MFATLVRHQGQVLSLDQLEESVWGDLNSPSGRINRLRLGNVVLNLRHKLSRHYWEDQPTEEVEGFGYRYRPQSR
jgi:DNA-binding response OmpR family regulator